MPVDLCDGLPRMRGRATIAGVVAADESGGEVVEIDQLDQQIERDRVDADPDERAGPELPFPDVDDQIEEGEEDRAVAGGDENVGAGPDFFDDRELQAPKKTD